MPERPAWDNGDGMMDSSEMVAMMRKDLIITKNLWDVTSVVQTTLEEWRSVRGVQCSRV